MPGVTDSLTEEYRQRSDPGSHFDHGHAWPNDPGEQIDVSLSPFPIPCERVRYERLRWQVLHNAIARFGDGANSVRGRWQWAQECSRLDRSRSDHSDTRRVHAIRMYPLDQRILQ